MSNITENKWDKLLKIRTSGRDDSHADQYRYPYEPTPYCVLERLAASGKIQKKNTLLDYGCGKGRVEFFLSWQTRCHSIGIEYDQRIFQKALDNQSQSVSGHKTQFKQICAEQYIVPENIDRIYFFNPFSIELLKKVVRRILDSYYRCPRNILLFFYYPSDEYLSFLMTVQEFIFYDEIDCRDLFEGNNDRETIIIFQLQRREEIL